MNPRRMLSCGVNYMEFDTAYDNLPPELENIIYNVANRLWVTHILRYQTKIKGSYIGPNEIAQLELFDWPALEIYLLFTCIDTLANKEYSNFYAWLKEQIQKGQYERDKKFSLDDIKIMYHQQYQPAKGIGSNIRRLLENLPAQTKQWLSENIKIRKLDIRIVNGEKIDTKDTPPSIVDTQEINDILKEIYRFFYNTRRNPFTHQSQSLQTYRSDDIELREAWRFTPTTDIYRRDSKYGYSIMFREGLDEATILRVIIQSAVLQEMGIPVQSSTIDKYILNQSRLCAIHGFLQEIQDNSNYLRVLYNFAENNVEKFFNSNVLLHPNGIRILQTGWTLRLINRLNTNLPLENGLQQTVNRYLYHTNQLNSILNKFNTSHFPPQEYSNHIETIKEFLIDQSQTPTYKEILQMPSKTEMQNLELIVAQDPCYT